MLRTLVLALVLAALSPAIAPAPALDGAPLVALAPEFGLADGGELPAGTVSSGAEPMVLVARSGAILVGDTSGLRRSDDGGATWMRSPNPFPGGFFTDGWALAQDAAGTLYAAKTQGHVISVAASDDDGRSWPRVSTVVGAGAVADRPWLAAGAAGHVALVWYQAGLGEWCAASTDGGVTWLGRTTSNVGFSNAGNLHMDADGTLWYAEDYGIHRWNAGCAGPLRTLTLPPSGAQIFTQLARTPAGDNFVAQPYGGAMELRGVHGLDKASLKRLVVSPSDQRTTSFGAVAARGDDEIAVAWYGTDAAGDPSSSAFRGDWNVYVARVTGFWTPTPTVVVTKVTDTPNHKGWFCMSGVTCSGGRALLDYFGVAYDADGDVHVAYGHDVGGTQVRHALVPAP